MFGVLHILQLLFASIIMSTLEIKKGMKAQRH